MKSCEVWYGTKPCSLMYEGLLSRGGLAHMDLVVDAVCPVQADGELLLLEQILWIQKESKA